MLMPLIAELEWQKARPESVIEFHRQCSHAPDSIRTTWLLILIIPFLTHLPQLHQCRISCHLQCFHMNLKVWLDRHAAWEETVDLHQAAWVAHQAAWAVGQAVVTSPNTAVVPDRSIPIAAITVVARTTAAMAAETSAKTTAAVTEVV